MEINRISIEKTIIHKVDHLKDDEPQFSDLVSPITPPVDEFLKGHIISNREHTFTRFATFYPSQKKNGFKKVCDDILRTSRGFIPRSKKIAGYLFEAVKENKRISPSELVVCTFRENPGNVRQLALLKMDPEDSFVGEIQTLRGKRRIVLKPVPDVLPTGGLQKCAFILPQEMREKEGYDLKVLDMQQSRYGVTSQVASFFSEDFLKCQVIPNHRDLTYNFLSASFNWVDKKKDQWKPQNINRFKSIATKAIKHNVVNITNFLKTAIPGAQEQKEYKNYIMEKGITQPTFQTDRNERIKCYSNL
jgi:hypothetical protein